MSVVKITPQDWKRIEPLLGHALDLERAQRPAWMEALRASHADLAPLLERLLRTHDEAEGAVAGFGDGFRLGG